MYLGQVGFMSRSFYSYICNSTSAHLEIRTQLELENFCYTLDLYGYSKKSNVYICIKFETTASLVREVIIRVSNRFE